MKKSQWSMVNGQWSVTRSFKQIVLLLTFHFSLLTAFSQSVSANLDRDKILLGEQVTLQLNLTHINPLISFVAAWPQLNDSLNHIEVLKRTPIDTVEVNGTNSYQQNFTLTGFDSGRWQLGPFDFIIQDKTSGNQIKISSPPVYLTVLPVDVSSLKDYHPLKDVIEVSAPFNWLPVIIAVAVLIAAAITFIIIKKRKRKIVAPPKNVLPGTPFQRAMKKLEQLEHQSLTNDADIKKFHSDIDIICREYFEETTNVHAMRTTTSELFSRMNVFINDTALRIKMVEIFELNASVKFAKYMPPATQSKAILDEMMACLQQIDTLKQEAIYNANRMA